MYDSIARARFAFRGKGLVSGVKRVVKMQCTTAAEFLVSAAGIRFAQSDREICIKIRDVLSSSERTAPPRLPAVEEAPKAI